MGIARRVGGLGQTIESTAGGSTTGGSPPVSWPGLARPPTTFLLATGKAGDGWTKLGPDTGRHAQPIAAFVSQRTLGGRRPAVILHDCRHETARRYTGQWPRVQHGGAGGRVSRSSLPGRVRSGPVEPRTGGRGGTCSLAWRADLDRGPPAVRRRPRRP